MAQAAEQSESLWPCGYPFPACTILGLWPVRPKQMFWTQVGSAGARQRAQEKLFVQRNHTDVCHCSFSYHRPSGSQAVSPADRDLVLKHGLAVVDCSWAQLSSVPFHLFPKPNQRLCTAATLLYLVPYLVASNSVNYGKPWQLNCAEALAAGLFIAGLSGFGDFVLSKFKWGAHFFPLNRDLLEAYSACSTSAEVVEAQNRHISERESEKAARRLKSGEEEEDYFSQRNSNRIPESGSEDEGSTGSSGPAASEADSSKADEEGSSPASE